MPKKKQPTTTKEKQPGIVVIHENRGLNPDIEDVARRVGVAGFVAFAPDALTPLGGYPGNDDEGRTLQRQRDRGEMAEDVIAAIGVLRVHSACNGKMGAVGFCFGGGMCNALAVRLGRGLAAAVPFCDRQPADEDVPKIKAALLLHHGGLDQRVNERWPADEAALKKAEVDYTAHMYADANHGFHNDTTPRCDAEQAKLAWQRTIDFFNAKLRDDD